MDIWNSSEITNGIQLSHQWIPVDISMKHKWKSIGNQVEISMKNNLKFQLYSNGNPLDIQLKFQWNTNGNQLEIKWTSVAISMEYQWDQL